MDRNHKHKINNKTVVQKLMKYINLFQSLQFKNAILANNDTLTKTTYSFMVI